MKEFLKIRGIRMIKNECNKCEMSHKDPIFWDTHQTMSDNNIWCTKGGN